MIAGRDARKVTNVRKAGQRCAWPRNPLAVAYHDKEWGVPVRNDRKLFEFLVLEGAQAGLSWDTILAKRENYRIAFDNFDPAIVGRYGVKKKVALLNDAGIVRHRAKIDAAVLNARLFCSVQREFGSFSRYLRRFTATTPIQPRMGDGSSFPTRSPESDALSADLRQRGFKFVGTTIMYAFMQAVGVVNGHSPDCFRHGTIAVRIGHARRLPAKT